MNRIVFAFAATFALETIGCAPTCDTAGNSNDPAGAALDNLDNGEGEPTECGGLCRPDRCPAGYYYVGPPNCSCLPKK